MATAASALRARRQAAGLSQEQLAERCRLSVRTIRNLERGIAKRPHRDTLTAVAAALDLVGQPADDFIEAWREASPDRFLADRAREDVVTGQVIRLRRKVRELAVSHTVGLGADGRWGYSITRRTFEAAESGVDTVAWMIGHDASVPRPNRIVVSDCVNLSLREVKVLPASGAMAFIGDLGGAMAVGEVRTVEYRLDITRTSERSREQASDREILFAPGYGMQMLALEARFDPAARPSRVLAVRRQTVADASRDDGYEVPVAVSPFGVATHVVLPASSGVYGLRWDWGDAR